MPCHDDFSIGNFPDAITFLHLVEITSYVGHLCIRIARQVMVRGDIGFRPGLSPVDLNQYIADDMLSVLVTPYRLCQRPTEGVRRSLVGSIIDLGFRPVTGHQYLRTGAINSAAVHGNDLLDRQSICNLHHIRHASRFNHQPLTLLEKSTTLSGIQPARNDHGNSHSRAHLRDT